MHIIISFQILHYIFVSYEYNWIFLYKMFMSLLQHCEHYFRVSFHSNDWQLYNTIFVLNIVLCWLLRTFACLNFVYLFLRDLYQVLLGEYLCQRWIIEFKGVMLYMIFFFDFVTPQKHTMSEECWLFTLKMAVQSLGNRDFTFRWFQPNMNKGKKR